jgi:prepilin-type N-terminal cleavage/methylation domain-containing protein
MKVKKAFTLLELMVAMGIVAILAAISVVGVSVVQRSLRNTERRKALESINLAIAEYFGTNGSYPALGVGGLQFFTDHVELEGNTIVNLTGSTQATNGTSTTSAATAYCYTQLNSGGSYSLGVDLEGSSWGFQLGDPLQADCNTQNVL